jgi:hypothetical protein
VSRFLSGGGHNRGGVDGLGGSLLLLGSRRHDRSGLDLDGLGSLLSGRLSGLGLGVREGRDSGGVLGLLSLLGLTLALRIG